MLNRVVYYFILALSLALPVAHAAETKIVVVNMQLVELKSIGVATVSSKVQDTKDKMQNDLSQREKSLQKEAEDLQSRSALLSQEVIKQKKESLQRKFSDFQMEFQAVSDSLEKIKLCSFDAVQNEMKKVIKIVADRGRYDLIIPSSALLYSGANIPDITEDVINELNNTSKSINVSSCFDGQKTKKK